MFQYAAEHRGMSTQTYSGKGKGHGLTHTQAHTHTVRTQGDIDKSGKKKLLQLKRCSRQSLLPLPLPWLPLLQRNARETNRTV